VLLQLQEGQISVKTIEGGMRQVHNKSKKGCAPSIKGKEVAEDERQLECYYRSDGTHR